MHYSLGDVLMDVEPFFPLHADRGALLHATLRTITMTVSLTLISQAL
jgi:hypothetical protein